MSREKTGGIGFIGLLTILFIGLKLTGYIAWNWFWVLCPLWIPVALASGIIITICLSIIVIYLANKAVDIIHKDKKRR